MLLVWLVLAVVVARRGAAAPPSGATSTRWAATGPWRRSRASRWRAPPSSPTRSAAPPRRSPASCSPATPSSPTSAWATRTCSPRSRRSPSAARRSSAAPGSYLGTIAGALLLTILTGLLPIFRLDSGALRGHLRRWSSWSRSSLAAPPVQALLGRAGGRGAGRSLCTFFQRRIVNERRYRTR